MSQSGLILAAGRVRSKKKNGKKNTRKKNPPHPKHTTKSTAAWRPRPTRGRMRGNTSHALAHTLPLPNGSSRAPPDTPRPRDRAKSHPHSSPRDPRRQNGRRSQTRRATIFKVALPEMASNHYIFCWLNGRALHSGQSVS